MVQHRCTRCKEDVGEFGIRHKYASGLFCEPCLRSLGARQGGVGRGIFGFISDIWHKVAEWTRTAFKPTLDTKNRQVRVFYNTMKAKARDIPPDARTMSPQKR